MKISGFLAGALVLFALPAFSTSFPGLGNGDALCMTTSGPTVCMVNEGQGDQLVEVIVNELTGTVLLNSITAGPISAAVPDMTDVITSDPVSFFQMNVTSPVPCVPGVTVLAAMGGSCYFVQSFTTGTPGDPDDGMNIPMDGTSNMRFDFTFTPAAGAVPVGAMFSCSNGQANNIGFCSVTPGRVQGSFNAEIQSATVMVNDVSPEPGSMLLLGTGLAAFGLILRRRSRR